MYRGRVGVIKYRKHRLSRKEKILVAAGFFEGEGWPEFNSSFGLRAKQNNVEPLLLMQKLFGGSIHRYDRTAPSELSTTPYYRWTVYGKPAFAAAEAMYPYLSLVVRRKIRRAVRKWETR